MSHMIKQRLWQCPIKLS
ncbi:hypothetical protein [Lysinibacillus sp. RS5]